MKNHRKKVVVIVDDDADWREFIMDVTESLGFETVEAATAEKALDASRNLIVDIAVIDVFMPGKGGLWLIDEIKAQHPGIKIVSTSGGYQTMSGSKAMLAAAKIGSDSILPKPARVDELEKIITELAG
ncbi:MAG: response regulator [Magnetovibrionaceae bacterium]